MRWENGRRKHKNIVAFSTKVQSSPPKQHGQTSSSAILTRRLADLITFLSLVSEMFFRTCTETYVPLSRITFRFHSLLFNKIYHIFIEVVYKTVIYKWLYMFIRVFYIIYMLFYTHRIIYWIYKKQQIKFTYLLNTFFLALYSMYDEQERYLIAATNLRGNDDTSLD